MKKLIIPLMFVLPISYCFGQNSLPASGNVGIGIGAPVPEKFYVREEGLLRPTFESITSVKWLRTNMDFKRSRGTIATKLAVEYNDKLGSIYFQGYDGANYIESSEIGGIAEGVSAGVVKSGIYFGTNDGTDAINNLPKTRMYITASGNVLINPKTNSGGNLLPESANGEGKLQVSGLIRAKEVKVETNNWPDFVFAKGYKLATLSEIEQQIKRNGHLPGIPSATEAEKNGIELGEMNKKLLQKIEELTLYLIDMKKENEQQNKEIKALKSKLK
jgi:hypothetical protein